jgi:malonyl-CoA O-methyltransferase
MIDKEIIKRNFSRYAAYYDRYSSIQNLCASRLISKIKTNNFANILEVGCGTGNYTKLLSERFSKAKIKTIDISFEMIKVAKEKLPDRKIEFVLTDGETADFNERFDLISSNACFQWFTNLEKSLARYKRLLNRNGVISFSTFGPLTFRELDISLRELFIENIETSSCAFLEKINIKKILKSLFKEIEIEQKIYKETYASLSELLKKIKYTGTTGSAEKKRNFWTPQTIDKLEKIYKGRFKGITATYEALFCKGVK